MTPTAAQPALFGASAIDEFKADLHPRGFHGRFTKSFSRVMTPGERRKAERVAGEFRAAPLDVKAFAVPLGGRSSDESAAIDRFNSGGWKAVNTALRAGKDHPDVAHLDAAMQPLPHDTLLHRQVPLTSLGKSAADPEAMVGRKVNDAAYAPTSVTAPTQSGDAVVRMNISAPAGTKALALDGDGNVLLARDSEMGIESVTADGRGGYDMNLVVLPKGRLPAARKTSPTLARDTKTVKPKPPVTATKSATTSAGYGLNGPVKDTEAATHQALVRYHEATARGLHDKAHGHLREAAAATGNAKLAKSLSAAAERDVPPNSPALDTGRFNKHQRLANRHNHAAQDAAKAAIENEVAGQAAKLAEWRADAAKPGRAASTETKRDTYVASWQHSIDHLEQQLAQAETKGDSHAAARLRKELSYYTTGRDAIKARKDPELDKPAPGRGKLAQAVNPARPLAVYGDMLHLDGRDDGWTAAAAANLEQIPAQLHGTVAERMAATANGGIWIGEGGVSNLDHADDLSDEKPRGWEDGKTFNDVHGVYRPAERQMLIGQTELSKGRGALVASHEFGHALDAALGNVSSEQEWQAIHDQVLATADYRLSPYYKQPGRAGRQEFWAEAFQVWSGARPQSSSRQHEAAFQQAFGVPPTVGRQIIDYFEQVARNNGVTG